MIRSDAAEALVRATVVNPISLAPRLPELLARYKVGEQIPAHVISRQEDGLFRVRVGDEVFELALPSSTQPKQSLQLLLLAHQPELTLAISRSQLQSSPSPTTAAPVLAQQPSEDGRWVGRFLSLESDINVNTSVDLPLNRLADRALQLGQQVFDIRAPARIGVDVLWQFLAHPSDSAIARLLAEAPVGEPVLNFTVLQRQGLSAEVAIAGWGQVTMNLPLRYRVNDSFAARLVLQQPWTLLMLEPSTWLSWLPENIRITPRSRQFLQWTNRLRLAEDEHQRLSDSPPLLSAPPPQAEALASALNQALDSSGLCYEAQMLEWLEGQRSLESLRQAPQERLKGEGGSDEHTWPLVAEQLSFLEGRGLCWQGQLLPGVAMRWFISPRHQSAAERQRNGRHVYATTLEVDWPHLGTVTTTLWIGQDRVHLGFKAEDPTALLLEQGRSRLVERLDQLGLFAQFHSPNPDVSAEKNEPE